MFSRKSPCESRKRGKRGKRGKRWGTLERVPQTPQNFSRINLLLGRRWCRFQGKCHPKQSLHRDKPVPRRFRPGCRGRSPRQSKLKISPFPTGEGGRGNRGQENQLKAVATGNKESTPPTERVVRPMPPVPPGFKPRGCKGRSPLHKITINLPLPQRGRGSGG